MVSLAYSWAALARHIEAAGENRGCLECRPTGRTDETPVAKRSRTARRR
jgi:hypothetical protein